MTVVSVVFLDPKNIHIAAHLAVNIHSADILEQQLGNSQK